MVRVAVSRTAFQVLDDWRDPDGVEAHVLNVIKLIDDTLPRAAAVHAVAGVAGGRRPIRGREPVCDKLDCQVSEESVPRERGAYLVDRALLPFRCSRSERGGRERTGCENAAEHGSA